MESSLLQHLLILCCYGGVPFINYETADNSRASSSSGYRPSSQSQLHPLDLTDWVAIDEPGQFLNASLHPDLLPSEEEQALEVSAGGEPLNLEQCDLYNLTFSSFADEHLFHTMGGRLECRCPARRYGKACYLRKFHATGSVSGRKALNKKRDLSPQLQTFTHSSPSSNSILSYAVNPQRSLADELAELTPREGRENHSAARATGNRISSNGSEFASSEEVQQQMSPAVHNDISDETAGNFHAAHGQHHSFALYLVIMLVFMLAMAALFTMMRGCCWVDCFGGFKMPFSSPSSRQASHLTADAPLDPAMLNRCLDAVRAHEENEKNKYATSNVFADSRRPLISSVSEYCPYQPTTIPANAVPVDYYRPLPNEIIGAGYQQPSRNPQYLPPAAAVELVAPVYIPSVDQNRTRQQPSPPPSYKSLEI